MKFSLAHFSDVHLGPLPKGSILRHYSTKKLVGALSWHFNRKYHHLPNIANALRADIVAANVDHVAFTGDIANISGWEEFDQGLQWLSALGSPDFVSYTPGNHDAYVEVPWQHGLGKFGPYMNSENPRDQTFPFIRLRRNIALIGLNSASPQSVVSAGGTIGSQQLDKLVENLAALKQRGFYRVVMVHHPAAPGLAHVRRALTDVSELNDTLKIHGAELVIHGHNHEHSLNYAEGKSGLIPIIGVPSASMKPSEKNQAAAWNRYDIARIKGQWQTRVFVRQWDANLNAMRDANDFLLETAAL